MSAEFAKCDRAQLKAELLASIAALDPQQALLPAQATSLAPLIEQLEACTPIADPLSPENSQVLSGEWTLIYATRGTVVTRRLPAQSNPFGSVTVERVWQVLSAGSQTVAAENGAILTLPIVGRMKLCAYGSWRWEPEEAKMARVSFGSFALQLQKPFGWLDWSLPTLKIPVLEAWRREAQWTTSYLDEDLRVGRGATGNLFVFKRV
jgi:hypothetical protein